MALVVKPLDVKEERHPPPPFPQLMRHEFSAMLVAPKGSGKTTLIVNMLDFYKGYFHEIRIYSPTINADPKWEYVEKQKGYTVRNHKLEEWLEKHPYDHKLPMTDRRNQKLVVVIPPPRNQWLKEKVKPKADKHDGSITKENLRDSIDLGELAEWMEKRKKEIAHIKKHGKDISLYNRCLIIFDDMVGSGLFAGTRNNCFKMLNANHRHYSCSILEVTQAYKEIPKTIRTQMSGFMFFRIANLNELKVIYEELPADFNQKDWFKIYDHITSKPHAFLFINLAEPYGHKMWDCFKGPVLLKTTGEGPDKTDIMEQQESSEGEQEETKNV